MHSDCDSCTYHDSCFEKACIRETRREIDAEVVVNVTAHELVVVNACPLHDCWGPYWKYQDVLRAVCCSHLLRELNGVEENHPEQTWAARFKELLLAMKKVKDKTLADEKEEISYYYLHKFDKQYDEILKTAYEENPLPETTAEKRGRREKSKVRNLICGLENYKASVCLFIKNLCVPFDNNQLERDLRMIKVKAKVSGCFRSLKKSENSRYKIYSLK